MEEVLPNRGRKERVTSANERVTSANGKITKPLSRESGSVDNLREMNRVQAQVQAQAQLQAQIANEENNDKIRIVRHNPGLPPRKELEPQKRQISYGDVRNTPVHKKDQISYDNVLGVNNSDGNRQSREGNRPPLPKDNPIFNSKQDELISKYQRVDPRIQQIGSRYESPSSYRGLYSENNPDKKVDYLLQKYNPDQYSQKPPTPSSKQNSARNQDLLMKYNNVNKQGIDSNRSPGYMVPYARQYSPSRNQGIIDLQNLRNSPSDRAIASRPIWWG